MVNGDLDVINGDGARSSDTLPLACLLPLAWQSLPVGGNFRLR